LESLGEENGRYPRAAFFGSFLAEQERTEGIDPA
jgi:hypothetical protein